MTGGDDSCRHSEELPLLREIGPLKSGAVRFRTVDILNSLVGSTTLKEVTHFYSDVLYR